SSRLARHAVNGVSGWKQFAAARGWTAGSGLESVHLSLQSFPTTLRQRALRLRFDGPADWTANRRAAARRHAGAAGGARFRAGSSLRFRLAAVRLIRRRR